MTVQQPAVPFVNITTSEIPYYVNAAWRTFEASGFAFAPVLYFESEPGAGKSYSVRLAASEIAEAHGLDLRFHSQGPPEDGEFGYTETQMANSSEEIIAGLPWADKDENVQRRAMVSAFPTQGPGIWFCDEPMQAPYTQRFLAQLTQRGMLDDYYAKPENVLMVLAGNGAKDRAGVQKMYTHFRNRICCFKVTPTVEGALDNFEMDAAPEVMVYLRWFPDKLTHFDPKVDGPYPTARTWDYCNSLLVTGADPIKDFPLYQGYLGHDHALDFRACFQAVKDLPNIEEMVENPDEMAIRNLWANNQAALCAMSFVCLRRLEQRDVDFAGKALEVFEIASLEIAASYLAVAKTIDRRANDDKSILDSSAYARFVSRNARLVAN